MLILGVDVGYRCTKYCSERGVGLIKSTYRVGASNLPGADEAVINYMGEVFTIGEDKNAKYTTSIDKINDLSFTLPLYTAVAKAMDNKVEDIYLVTGLPVKYYSQLKDKLITCLEGVTVRLLLNGEDKKMDFKKVFVYPQGAGYFLLHPELFDREGSRNLVIDWGSLTINAVEYKNFKPVDFQSYPSGGIFNLFTTLKSYFEVKYSSLNAKFSLFDMEDVVSSGSLYIQNKKTDDDKHIDDTCRAFVKAAITNIGNDFNYGVLNKIFIGGSSLALKKFLPVLVESSTIYDNAKIFYEVGAEKWRR